MNSATRDQTPRGRTSNAYQASALNRSLFHVKYDGARGCAGDKIKSLKGIAAWKQNHGSTYAVVYIFKALGNQI